MDFSATAQAMFHRLAADQDPAVAVPSFWLHRIDDVYPFEDQFFDHCICFTALAESPGARTAAMLSA